MLKLKSQNKYILNKKRNSFMFNTTHMTFDIIQTKNQRFSIFFMQGLEKDIEIPEIIKKNIALEITDNIVFFTELLAKD